MGEHHGKIPRDPQERAKWGRGEAASVLDMGNEAETARTEGGI